MPGFHLFSKIISLLLLTISLCACGNRSAIPEWKISRRMTRVIQLANNFPNDTCIVILSPYGDSLVFDREIDIEENTFQDTLNVGFSALAPGVTGRMVIYQQGNTIDKSLDPEYYESEKEANPEVAKTNMLCIYKLSGKGINRNDRSQVITIRIKPL